MSGMKKIIDKWVSNNYERMRLLAAARCTQYGRNIDPGVLVSNCYEYLISKKSQLTPDKIESYAFQFINMQVIWLRSNTNKEELQTTAPFYKSLQYDYRILEAEADTIDEKIKEEEVYHERKAIIALYLEKVKNNKVQTRLLEVMLREKLLSSRKIAAHFNISHTGAWLLIKQLKGDIQQFKKELNEYDKKANFNG